MNFLKSLRARVLAALALAFCVVNSAFAEGGTPIVDTSTASTAIEQIKTDLSGWVTTVMPYLLGILGAFLVFWLVKLAVRIIRGFVGTAKG